jgi:chaperone required for assembly of F1-ATPase
MKERSAFEAPRRFYETVTAAPAPGGGWQVLLDGRSLKTPARSLIRLPAEALARAVAAEWSAQEGRIDLAVMALTRLANVALDRTPELREEMAEEILRYCETDLLCHIAEDPYELALLEEARWSPVRDWAAETLGVDLITTEGIVAVPQPPASLDAARAYALGLDDFRLTGLVYACGLFGSALLAMATVEGALDAASAFTLSRLDEDWQADRWGEDEEARAIAETKREDAKALGQWLDGLRE